jgi:hypothetical protein
MSALHPTPAHHMVDGAGRPYFLWDVDMTLARFRELLRDPDPAVRAYLIGKLMRQAKPDDVFQFVSLREIEDHWTDLERYLGNRRAFWCWLLATWREQESVLVDLVAEPVAVVEPPVTLQIGDASILVDTPHEILVNKLCALLSRAELRDLVDLRALLERGGDLDRALRDAPRKDGGFSVLMLAWILKDLPIERLAKAAVDEQWVDVGELARFRDELVARLAAAGAPNADP